MTQDANGRWRDRNGRYMTVTITKGRDINRGRNARGICAHKATKGAKRAKRQIVPNGGPREVTAYRMNLAKARGRLA